MASSDRRTKPGERISDQPLVGIMMKIASVIIFVAMSSFIKAAGELPAGQIVFYRSFFAILPIVVFLGVQGELRDGWKTQRPGGHLVRGLIGVSSMGLGFFALTRLPLPEWITLGYAQPLLVVAFSALFLREAVNVYRWSAVFVGMVGVLIVSWPKLTLLGGGAEVSHKEFVGVLAALGAATLSAIVMLQVRSLVTTEKSATIVLWFSITASVAALLTLPFGWDDLSSRQLVQLILAGLCGGIAQIFMTEAYRYAPASIVAPFEYTSLILGLAIGFAVFDELPTIHMILGASIIIAAGIYIIWRERKLGLQRGSARKVTPPQ